MKSLQELTAIKERVLAQNQARKTAEEQDTKVIVGMATCGIAAGARTVMNSFIEELAKRGIQNVIVSQTGCLGMCMYEPVVDVVRPGEKPVTYILMNREKAVKVVSDHIVNGNVVKEYTYEAKH